jgi:parallel beta-helix repeat protein
MRLRISTNSVANGALDTSLPAEEAPKGASAIPALAAWGFLIALTAQYLLFPAAAGAEVVCTKYAAPGGSDGNAGTASAPFRTVQKLVDALQPGQTGCLRSGTYAEADQTIDVTHGGTAEDRRITISSAPGERAELKGRLWIAREADYVTVRDLDLNGANTLMVPAVNESNSLPSPMINGDHAEFVGNDVTNDRAGICFLVGHEDWGIPTGTLIQNNRVHDCGRWLSDPRANHHHGVYVGAARETKVLGNLIYDNADYGVKLYNDARGTVVEGNIIDNNGGGVIFAGDGGPNSENNTVRNNVISNSREYWNVESWWPNGAPTGRGNTAQDNCLSANHSNPWFNTSEGVLSPQEGFTAVKNTGTRNPMFMNRIAKDFRLSTNSPCKSMLDGAHVTPSQAPPPSLRQSPPILEHPKKYKKKGKKKGKKKRRR